MLCKRGLCRYTVSVRPSVCLSVTFVYSVKTNKHGFRFFRHRVVIPFKFFRTKQHGNIPKLGVEWRWGRQKSRFCANIRLHRVLSTLRPPGVINTRCRTVASCDTYRAASKRQSLLMAGDDNEMFMRRSVNVTPKTTEQHLITRSDKSVAYVTNNKIFCSTFCTIEANYWQTRSITRPLRACAWAVTNRKSQIQFVPQHGFDYECGKKHLTI